MSPEHLTIATRKSKLALTQTEWVRGRILATHPEMEVDVLRIRTTGDKVLDKPLAKIGGKGLFVKEIEEALLDGRADLAVHSMKDMPADVPAGLVIGAVPERENPGDALISRGGRHLDAIPEGARIGTSSLRRGAQLLARRPDLHIVPMRGNVDTRLRKLEAGEVDAIILAAAGLSRLGLSDRITQVLPADLMLPAIGQGALAIEIRDGDAATSEAIRVINDAETEITVSAERAFLGTIGGGCEVPVAAAAHLDGERITLRGFVGSVDGHRSIYREGAGEQQDAEALGRAIAREILEAGGEAILAEIEQQSQA